MKRSISFADMFHNEVTAWVVLGISLIITGLGWFIADSYVERRAADRFQFEVEDARQRILKRMLDYEQVLRGGVALFDTLGRTATRQEWHHYVRTLQIQTYFPGIQGIGFSTMLMPSKLQAHIDAVRKDGFPDYQVRPGGERDIYSAIVYLEPFDWRNQRAFGYDMFSNPMRRSAMERARDTAKPSVSGKVTLVQETKEDVQAGFLVYLPVYRSGLPTKTVAQRREAHVGFVYAPFRVTDLMKGILGSETPDVRFVIYDGQEEQDEASLLYNSNPGDLWKNQAAQQFLSVIELPGRTWTVHFHSSPSFDINMSSTQPELIAFGGLTVDILLFLVIWSLAGERRRVQAKAEAMTADIRDVTQRLNLAQESAQIGTWDYNPISGELIWDDRLYLMYDMPKESFSGGFDAWQSRVHPDDLERTEKEFKLAIEGGRRFHTHFRILHRNGDIRVLEAYASVLRNEMGKSYRVVGVNLDITERRETEERLLLAASVFDHAHEGIVVTDPEERILEVNPTFTELTGYSRDEVIGQTPRVLKSGHHDTAFYKKMWIELKQRGFWRGEIWNRRKNGEIYAEFLTISTVRNPQDKVTHYVAVFSDITTLKDQQARLERMAHYDVLTQLPNRVLLADRMRQAMVQSQRTDKQLAICYLDLDGFKPVNDTYGHDIGDKLLIKVAHRLAEHLRASDSVSRLGGDEFVLLFSNIEGVPECERALTRLLEAVSTTHAIDGHRIQISASIGVTLYPQDNVDADTLLRHADQAMYRAKESGRNRFHLFDPEQDRQARAHREALERIELALQTNEFRLYYQPKVDMRHGHVLGAEALIRWQHPEKGLLPPSEFLPVVEETDFAAGLGEWVLHEALRQLVEWKRSGFETNVSVNISGRHFQQDGFVNRLGSILNNYPGISPQRLELEVLETTAIGDINLASRMIEECRVLGVSVSLDDFGTGYSSLTYLKRLPVNTIKIDQSFVQDMLQDPDDLAIIEGIVGLSQAFHRQVIAEGVESQEHGEMLLHLGCEYGQGYGIAQPMRAADFPGWVESYVPYRSWQESGEEKTKIKDEATQADHKIR
ncbi:MAG: EAL domain-containing protein [Candidatus Thiodiazotropha endolucinida]